MTINQERPKGENAISKLARYATIFEFRNSSFNWKLAMLLTLVMGMGAWLRPTFGTERVWDKSFELPPGGHVSVVNVHGSILVEGWDRSEVQATVAMRSKADTDQLGDVQVAVEAHKTQVTFHTLYPPDLNTPVRVDYRLRVPRQVHLDELSTLQGDIVLHDVEGTVEARNLHGDIEGINVSGSVVAHALTGNILVSLRALPAPPMPFTLATLNGNVDLMLPARADADLELYTVAGNIAGDYSFQASSTPGDSTRHVHLGTGGVHIELRTVRGNIRVERRDGDL